MLTLLPVGGEGPELLPHGTRLADVLSVSLGGTCILK